MVLVHLLGHGLGHASWDKPEDVKMQEVINLMKGYKSTFMGATKSMADYYNGYSLILFLVYTMTIAILWFASGFIEHQKSIAVKILYPIAITYLAFAGIEYLYFFPFAASVSFLAGLLTLLSITIVKN